MSTFPLAWFNLFVCLFVCLFSEAIQDQAKFKEIGISFGSVDQLARVRLSFSFLDARLHSFEYQRRQGSVPSDNCTTEETVQIVNSTISMNLLLAFIYQVRRRDTIIATSIFAKDRRSWYFYLLLQMFPNVFYNMSCKRQNIRFCKNSTLS